MKNKIMQIPPADSYQIRCPKLGHQISFSYCRREDMGSPCFKTIDCWFSHFPVTDYLQDQLSAEEWQESFEAPRKPKMLSLLELIEKAKQNKS